MASDKKAQWQLIEEKKQALLKRIEEKKRNSTDINPPLPQSGSLAINSQYSAPPPPTKPGLYVNDGSFLARFQAMQKQKPPTNTDISLANKTPVSLKITALKKNTPTKPALRTHDVFERDDGPVKNGKHSF